MENERAECPKCDGTGKQEEEYVLNGLETRICKRCNGTGKVRVCEECGEPKKLSRINVFGGGEKEKLVCTDCIVRPC